MNAIDAKLLCKLTHTGEILTMVFSIKYNTKWYLSLLQDQIACNNSSNNNTLHKHKYYDTLLNTHDTLLNNSNISGGNFI